jgi:hypothetical protein
MIVVFILVRLLLIAALVFVIGYVFGNFSRKKSLTTLAKISTILLVAMVIIGNVFAFRFAGWRNGRHQHQQEQCYFHRGDSTAIK